MSRSGYSDDCDDTWALIRWRGAVKSAIRGKRGQAMLRETIAALDALPEKKLAADSLINTEGEYCTLGALGRAREINLTEIDPEDREAVANAFGISEALAAEIMYLNDEAISRWFWQDVEICGPMRPQYPHCERHKRIVRMENEATPENRWAYMRNWLEKQIAH